MTLRQARANYVDARQYRRSSSLAYWLARAEYLAAIRATEVALNRKLPTTRGIT